jgi:hypothetical protein
MVCDTPYTFTLLVVECTSILMMVEKRDTPCMSVLTEVERDTSYTLHVHTAGIEKGYTLHSYCCRWKGYTLSTSILLAMQSYTTCTFILLVLKRDTPCTHTVVGGKDTPSAL